MRDILEDLEDEYEYQQSRCGEEDSKQVAELIANAIGAIMSLRDMVTRAEEGQAHYFLTLEEMGRGDTPEAKVAREAIGVTEAHYH